MKFPPWLPVFGDQSFRGKCPIEDAEQITFFNLLRKHYPDTYGIIALHPKNESKRRGAQFRQLEKDKAMGLAAGASDVIIPGSPALVLEIKRQDHTQSKWQKGQIEYLEAAKEAGCFVGVALGYEAAWQAFEEWINAQKHTS